MSKLNFIIDKEKCIHCGKCIEDCNPKIIKFDAEKFPSIKQSDEQFCMKCQHCLAICPVGAISIFNKSPKDSEKCNNFPNEDKMLNLIKSRRSYRKYLNENLDKERLQRLKDVLKYAPTGRNCHNLTFSIIDNVEVMEKFRNITNNKIKKILMSPCVNTITKKFARYKNAFLNGNDIIFRQAPHMIVVSAPPSASCANQDGIIALSYFELYAQSMGVGTLWSGLAQACLKAFPELCEFLEIPEGNRPIYVMLFGPTDLKYTRTTQPDDYNIISVKGSLNIKTISLSKKLKRLFWNNK